MVRPMLAKMMSGRSSGATAIFWKNCIMLMGMAVS
jgi:hypothetical protein